MKSYIVSLALLTSLCAAEPPYTNPILSRNVEIADPYVLKWNGEYYLYCSGDPIRAFHSKDLVRWTEIGPVLRSNPQGWNGMDVWAPEVVYRQGKFYMYYTATTKSDDWKAQERDRRIGVAVADSPRGPFVDSGQPLTPGWAIDGSVFTDPKTGHDYLFYSYLYDPLPGAPPAPEKYPPGAGIVVDRLLSPTKVANTPTLVTRGSEAWEDKDGDPGNGTVRYTNEGPVVLEKDGRFYAIYSGGSWDMPTYALAYAVSDQLMPAGGLDAPAWEKRPPILRGNRGVDGPGHNGVVKAPNNVDEQIVYHARVVPFVQPWNRFPFLDRLYWTGDRLYVPAPSLGGLAPPDRPLFTATGPSELPALETSITEIWFKPQPGGSVSLGPVRLEGSPGVWHEALVTRNGERVAVRIDGVERPPTRGPQGPLRAEKAEIGHVAVTDAFYDRSLEGWREANNHPPTFTRHDPQTRYEFSVNVRFESTPEAVGIAALAGTSGLTAGIRRDLWPFAMLTVQSPAGKWEAQLPRGFRYDQEHNLRMVRQDDLFTFFLDGQEMLAVRTDLPPTSPAVFGQRRGFSQARYKRLVVEQNLLGNGGFEAESSQPWQLSGGAMVNESEPNSGRRRLLIHEKPGQARQTLTLPAGAYKLEAYLRQGASVQVGESSARGEGPGWTRVSLEVSSRGEPLAIVLSGPPGAAFDDVYLYRP